MLNLSDKMYVKKHVTDIVPHNNPYFDDMTLENNSLSGDGHVHEDVKVDVVVSHVDVVNNNNKISQEIVTRNKA